MNKEKIDYPIEVAPVYHDERFQVFYRLDQPGQLFITVSSHEKPPKTYRAFPKPYATNRPKTGWAYYWKDEGLWRSTPIIQRLSANACQETDCKTPIPHSSADFILGSVYDSDEGKTIYQGLCPTCALEAGFCVSCGEYWAGNEALFYGVPGYCPNCEDEMEAINEMAEML